MITNEMSIIISAILIFILLSATTVFALIVPLDPEWPKTRKAINVTTNTETDSVLVQLAKVSKDVPAIVGLNY